METLLAALQGTGFAAAMRGSIFLYPVANVVHVLAALTFFAAVAAMDVKVLRTNSVSDARAFIDRVRPVAIAAFVVQAGSGLMLLAPEAIHIWHNPVFKLKVAAILLGLANVIVLEILLRRDGAELSRLAKAAAVVSLVVWLSTATLGRLIAYF
jgi:hypothetical protein